MRVQRTETAFEPLTLERALAELQKVAPTAPFLALGQTILWDEPMKGGIALAARALGRPRKLVAGVHDTDYFAKLPSGAREGGFVAVPHNDTKTKGLWSAAAEFSALFGSETVVTKEALLQAGLRLEKISKGRPNMLDEATEAWGWKGIVSLNEDTPIAADVKIRDLYPALNSTMEWATDLTLQSVADPQRLVSQQRAEHLRDILKQAYDEAPDATLGDYYERLICRVYNFSAGASVDVESTRTTKLLKFNRKTCVQPRFDLVNLFVSPDTAPIACRAYNEAIKGSEIYGLDRFGTGAIPFDLVIPGKGRGTIRVAPRAIVIMTHEPQFISLKQPLRHVQDLAEAVCSKFGEDCVLIGKAVSLIGMLAREFVFLFHEGASSYVKYSRKMHGLLNEGGVGLKLNPILRINLGVWDGLQDCSTWIRLPEPLQRPFGTEDLTAPSFAARWKDVVKEQDALLEELSTLRRPLDLIRFLEERTGGSWHCLACEYEGLHTRLEKVEQHVNELKQRRRRAYGRLGELKQLRLQRERQCGEHFRAHVFEKQPSQEDLEEREKLQTGIEESIHAIEAARKEIRDLMQEQKAYVSDPEIQNVHSRRRTIELEAELKRLRLIRQAIITSKGLVKANHRPSAWWFPLLCPDGGWFRSTIQNSTFYLEPLTP